MTDGAAGGPPNDHLDLLDGLIYADGFDCAVTLDELWRYARVAIERDALPGRLAEDAVLRELVVERDGLYCLADRAELLELRPRRIAHARRLQRRAQRVARVLRLLPFVRDLALTGSSAAGNAGESADVDLLVVVAARRLGIVFAMLGPLSRVLGRRVFCPNYYLSETRLDFQPGNLYVAHELAQACMLTEESRLISAANPWVATFFPNLNWPVQPVPVLRSRSRLQRALEAPLRGDVGDRLERAARRLAATRLRAHYGDLGHDVPAGTVESLEAGLALRFHGLHLEHDLLGRYAACRERVADRLGQVEEILASRPV